MQTSGGLELLFSNKRKHTVTLPSRDADGLPVTVAFLIDHLCDHLMQSQKKDVFVLDGSVCVYSLQLAVLNDGNMLTRNDRRPGILVLINDADWELEGEDKYEIQNNDEIVFVSTLHGG